MLVVSGTEQPDDRPQKQFRHLPAGRSIVTGRGIRVPRATSNTDDGHEMTKAAAGQLLGPVIYAIRLDANTIRIGWTTDLARRTHELGKHAKLLAFASCSTKDDTNQIHATVAAHRIRGNTYAPAPAVLQLVNDWRANLGMPALDPQG